MADSRGLFSKHPQRSAFFAGLAAILAYLAQRYVPPTPSARVIAEMVITFVSLISLTLFILAHHRRGSQRIINQTQEEVILIFIFGLFWFAFLIGIKSWNDRSVVGGIETESEPFWTSSAAQNLQSARIRGACSGGTYMCVKEGISW